MSFICDNCHEPQRNGIYPVKKVIKRREKRGGTFEIVKEINCCPRCKHHNHGMVTVPFNPVIPASHRTTADLKRHFNRR